MEKIELSEQTKKIFEQNEPLSVGDWSASCYGYMFKMNNNGIKFLFLLYEEVEKVVFDTDKKTVTVTVNNSMLKNNAPRTVDLSDAPEFFEEVRKNFINILTDKKFDKGFHAESVTANENMTEFKISIRKTKKAEEQGKIYAQRHSLKWNGFTKTQE